MEKRRFSRVSYGLKAFVRCRDVLIKGKVINLSLNGMFIRTDKILQTNDMVEITLYLSGTKNPLDISVQIGGTVMRTEKEGLVLQFSEIDLDSFSQLKNIIAYNDGNEDKVMEEFLRR